MDASSLQQFEGKSFMSLETFRKNGQGVPTPVWFAQENGKFYVTTAAGSGKTRRIRNNNRVRIAPCNMRGDVAGEWVEAQAHLVDDSQEAQKANTLLNRKYGLQKRLFEMFNKVQHVYLVVECLPKA